MKPDVTHTIYSFIIRFVVDDTPGEEGDRPAYHGAIRHIQSAEELNFNEWTEAVEFVRRFVPIQTLNDKPNPQEKKP
jgi:hypothetical protein